MRGEVRIVRMLRESGTEAASNQTGGYCMSQEIPDWNGVLALIRGLVAKLRIAAKKL